jgi:lipoprotein-anchoring transpeptidase ErfK/SrfK
VHRKAQLSGRQRAGRRIAASLVVVVVAGAALLASCGTGPSDGSHTTSADSKSGTSSTTPTVPAKAPPGSTLVATLHHDIFSASSPRGKVDGGIPATWNGAMSILPVLKIRQGWADVRLAQRPNESTAWVRLKDVTLSTTPYRIVVNLTTTHLTLYRSGRKEFSVPAGVGSTVDPTPTGTFFVALFAQPPSPGYGAFVMVTSAHSDTITDWESSGDALIAIHGPLGDDQEIGTTGTHISHGCIRLHEVDLLRLRNVPVGTPVDIVA